MTNTILTSLKKSMVLFIGLASSTCIFGQMRLDHNNVNAGIGKEGLVFSEQSSGRAYEVPKGSGLSTMWSAGLWVGGIDQNNFLGLAAATYNASGTDFFMGPISQNDSYSEVAYIDVYGQSVWKVSRAQIETHIQQYNSPGYVIPSEIANWPGNGMEILGVESILAPFVDLNNNGLYEPYLGDYPAIRGDEAVYTILNDAVDVHSATGGDILGIEVHLMYYQFESADYNQDATYLNVKIFNRGNNTYAALKTGLFVDGDLGNFQDDYIGIDSTRNMVYFYNGDSVDETGYEENPPAFGVKALNKELNVGGYFTSNGQFPHTDPVNSSQYFNYMNGNWSDGSDFVYGGLGYAGSNGATGLPTNFMFSGDPQDTDAWSMRTADAGGPIAPSDMRGFLTSQNTSLSPGEFICNDYVFLFSRSGTLNENLTGIFNQADSAQLDYDSDWRNECFLTSLNVEEQELLAPNLYPNPSSGAFKIAFGQPMESGIVEVFTSNGMVLESMVFQNTKEVEMDFSAAPGIYFVSVESGNQRHVQKLIIQ